MITIDASRISAANGNNVYVLFGYEAIQARPNLDPYTSTLRMNDETQQVYTSDVHLKHHVRRGMKAFARTAGGAFQPYADAARADGIIFYEKEDEQGNARSFGERLAAVRAAHGIAKSAEAPKDALCHCLDLPLFGYVHAVKSENFNVTNAANTLFRPVTFHACEILPLGRNNAFPGEGSESAGSASVDSLEYGFFLALWEINLNMLRINASGHRCVPWPDDATGFRHWLELLTNGMWLAYTTERYPSFTQRSQFAQFMLGWQPSAAAPVSYANPQALVQRLESRQIKGHDEAVASLNALLPDFLKGWQCTTTTRWLQHTADNCHLGCL